MNLNQLVVPVAVYVEVKDAVYGDVAYINAVIFPYDATGTVTVTIDNKTFSDNVVDGVAIVEITDLDAGKYGFEITYSGDSIYNGAYGNGDIEIYRAGSAVEIVDIADVVYDADVEVTYTVENATEIEVSVIDGQGNPITTGIDVSTPGKVIISGLAAGEYSIVITNAASENYNESYDMADFWVDRADSIVVIDDIADVVYNASVEVTYAIENETVVSFRVFDADGHEIEADINTTTPGKVIISGLDAGVYSILITNAEDENHTSSYDEAPFKVLKAGVSINPEATGDFVVDGEVNVTFTVPEDIDGDLTVLIDGDEFTGFTIVDGTCTIPGTYEAGEHIVTVMLTGDTNYEDAAGSATFNISKVDPVTTIDATSVVAGNDVIITVTVPEDATGVVYFDVDGKNYYAIIEDGEATLVLSDLAVGNYTVVYTYVGDDKYLNATGEGEFEVSINDTYDIKAESGAIQVGDDAEVTVLLPEDATGEVTVTVDGNEYTAPVEDGKATVTVPVLPAGYYTA